MGRPSLPQMGTRPAYSRAMPTQVLQKDPGYSRFYSVYLRFQQELRWGVTAETAPHPNGCAQDVSEIYEMWSIFGLRTSCCLCSR